MTTTVRLLTPANVEVLHQYETEIRGLVAIYRDSVVFSTTAADTLLELRRVKDLIRDTKGSRSFENRAFVAVLRKVEEYVEGGRTPEPVVETP